MVINVQRFGIHHQPTQIVVTFNGPLTPAEAENVNNYHLFTRGPDGKFSHEVPITSAVYDPATNSVTLTAAHQINVHHFSEIAVTNPCPGGPPFVGVLNRKFSLGAITGHNGHYHLAEEDECAGSAQSRGPAEEADPGQRASCVENREKALVECISCR